MTLLFEEDLVEAETLSVFCSPSVGTAESLVGALISVTVVAFVGASAVELNGIYIFITRPGSADDFF